MNTLCLNEKYSTTRLLITEKPAINNKPEDKFETVLFLPENTERRGEGGLRTQGYFKKSYKDKPLITIVTVVYNGEKHLEQTIRSVIEQNYDNVEYIIVDGGSTDDTLDIIKKYEDTIDYWVSEPDDGIYDAMNKGAALSTGEWINFMNVGDSFYQVNTIKNIFTQIDNHTVVLYGNVLNIYSPTHKVISLSRSLDTMYQGLPFSHQSSFTKSKYLRKFGFDLKYSICADYDFFYKLYIQKLLFVYTNNIIAKYDMFGTSTNYSQSFLQKKAISNIYESSKNKYFSTNRYVILKLKNYIKSYLTYNRVKKVKIWLSKNIYNRQMES